MTSGYRLSLLGIALLFAYSHVEAVDPSVSLPYLKIVGRSSISNIDRFRGIPYAEPDTKRFTEPKPINESRYPNGQTFEAFNDGFICPQGVPPDGAVISEECFNLNIAKPSSAVSGQNLPVLVWIYGGGFVAGSVFNVDPTNHLNYSMQIGLPFIHVAMNYRTNGFGFLSSSEVSSQGNLNLGLKDQRVALRWIQKYISYFGGDPNKVTIYGSSAGSISVGLQMLAYGGEKEENLFRAGIMESGGVNSLVIPPYSFFQPVYDEIVLQMNCKGKNNTLECLQGLSYETIKNYLFWYPGSLPGPPLLRPAYGPVVDFDLIPDIPYRLLKQGKFKRMPIIAGEQLDEGPAFINSKNWTFDSEVRQQVSYTWPNFTKSSLDKVMELYPNISSEGSPYNTGNRTYYGPQGKRAAAIYGDLLFTTPRRFTSEWVSSFQVPTWTYRFEYDYLPQKINDPDYLGVTHGYEFYAVYKLINNTLAQTVVAYWASFATHLNPNVKGNPIWENYNTSSLAQIRFQSDQRAVMKVDDYRRESTQFLYTVFDQMYAFSPEPIYTSTSLSSTSESTNGSNSTTSGASGGDTILPPGSSNYSSKSMGSKSSLHYLIIGIVVAVTLLL